MSEPLNSENNSSPIENSGIEQKIENSQIDGGVQGIQGDNNVQVQGERNVVNVNQGNIVQISRDKTSNSKPLTQEELRFRQVLLNKVRQRWIENVLEKSLLYENSYISIHWQNSPSQVKHSFRNEEEFSDEPQETLKTEINDVFVRMGEGRTLLILGKPGVGKTTTLLKLLEGLIQQIEKDLKTIPVVFNLSSWTSQQKNFAEWLTQELNSKYEVDKALAEDWIKHQQLILLLDGLDEVQKGYRKDCMQKINDFRQDYGLTEIVICSRIKEYKYLSEKLKLEKAICLQPLNYNQIQQYLDGAGEDLKALKILITEYPILEKLAKNPLTLTVMIVAYKNFSIQDLPKTASSEDELRKHLFDTYINQMLKRRLDTKKYKDDRQTKNWLIWLAQRMKNNQSIFQIEQIQSSWLLSGNYQKIYRILVGLTVGLLIGLIAGIYFIYVTPIYVTSKQNILLNPNIKITLLTIGLLSGLISGLFIGLTYIISNKNFRGLISGMIFATIITILFKIINTELLDSYICPIFLAGFFGGYICKFICEQIQPVDTIKPEWTKISKYSIISLAWGILYVCIRIVLYPKFYQNNTYYYLLYELLIFAIIGGIYGGFRIKSKAINRNKKILPNHGIRRSIKYTVISFTITAPSATLVVWLVEKVRDPLNLICISLTLGLMSGLAANEGSGIVSIQHFILRVMLWLKGDIPWNYARFLNYATERIFLRDIGGSYIFVHRMLLEHFAQMELNQERRSEGNKS